MSEEYIFFSIFLLNFLSILLDIQSREVNLPESIADKSAGGKWEGDESGWWLSNTRGGACNSEAAPYFNIVPSYIMFQQNGRRTRGSSAPSTGRVVYLEYTIPPRATLTLSPSFSLPLSFSLRLSQEGWRGRGRRAKEREKNREKG